MPLLLACTTDSTRELESPVVRDSADVRVVQYPGHLDPVETLEVGAAIYRHGSRPGDYLFERIIAGALRPDGSAVIADAGSNEVILIDPDGSLAEILLTEGQGPGEVQGVLTVHARGDDTTIVEDDGNGRILVLADEHVARSVRIDGMLAYGLMILGVSEEGDLLMGTSSFRSDAGDGWIPGYMVQLRLDSVPSPDTVGLYDMAISRPRGEPNDPFGAVGYLTATPDGFIDGRTDRAEFTWRGPGGRVRQIMRWVPQLAYPTQEDLDAFIERYRSMLSRFNPGMPADRVEEILDELEVSFDNPLPLFQALRGQSDGSLWLADYDVRNMMGSEPREYLALSPDGEELRKFVFPESVQILDVSDARVLGVVSSDMDVQHVVIYQLEP